MPSSLGERIREARERLNYSQRGLDAAAGICRGQTQLLESGARDNPGVKTLDSIAKALGVTLEFLLRGDEPARQKKKRSRAA